jgi:GMP synthase (glutamine-hydrolysing)
VLETIRYLLLQIRNSDDPMREHEVACFARALRCGARQIGVFDLLSGTPSQVELDSVDVILLGGSGHYSVASEGKWLDRVLDTLREIHAQAKPTFASCWGFQAMARAMGGRVVNDLENAEVGTLELFLTTAGQEDPIFGSLGGNFRCQAGHEDHVVELPTDAVLLASSSRVANQAYRFVDRPIYCTQFHPELQMADLILRLKTYPEYVRRIAGIPLEKLAERCEDSPEAEALLPRFAEHFFG